MTGFRAAYEAAGVNVGEGEKAVALLRQSLTRPGSSKSADLLGLTGFGAAFELPPGYQRPILVSATDGVGTKTEIARQLGRYDTIGRDLVAMCADDVVCHAARPLFFLDYLALGKLESQRVATIVRGIAEACAEIDCALVGGETAEHPGVMQPDEFDLAGFCVGVVEHARMFDGSAVHAGDAVVGLASSGLHANGYSLVRRLLAERRLPLTEALLEPTRLYAGHVLGLIDLAHAEGWRIGGAAHITGGGLPQNLPRMLPSDLGVEVEPRLWPVPQVIAQVASAAGLSGLETRATFNAGIGMALAVDRDAVERVIDVLAERGVEARRIGRVAERTELGGAYRELA